jgi:hypothetical protein
MFVVALCQKNKIKMGDKLLEQKMNMSESGVQYNDYKLTSWS